MIKKFIVPAALFALAGGFALIARADMEGGEPDGKTEFAKHCASCHVDGGNIVNPEKTLKKGRPGEKWGQELGRHCRQDA